MVDNAEWYLQRFWPGEGSHSIVIAVSRKFFQTLTSVRFCGRSVRLDFKVRMTDSRQQNVMVIAAHLPYDDRLEDELHNVVTCMRKRPTADFTLMLADWNIDVRELGNMVPSAADKERVEQIKDFLIARHLRAATATEILGVPVESEFAEVCRETPITRVPIGGQIQFAVPRNLDWMASSNNEAVTRNFVQWLP